MLRCEAHCCRYAEELLRQHFAYYRFADGLGYRHSWLVNTQMRIGFHSRLAWMLHYQRKALVQTGYVVAVQFAPACFQFPGALIEGEQYNRVEVPPQLIRLDQLGLARIKIGGALFR